MAAPKYDADILSEFEDLLDALKPLTKRIDAYTQSLIQNPFDTPPVSPEEIQGIQEERSLLLRKIGTLVYQWHLDGNQIAQDD